MEEPSIQLLPVSGSSMLTPSMTLRFTLAELRGGDKALHRVVQLDKDAAGA